ncbi:MAG: hydrocarbon-binding protein [Alphaproteobacteria bacterium]|nr:hydrocarbon-binding protein [Alphaproteobacteria bacterium]MCB9698144.1 hydrocarbon-binding protein [Alphaproteobacteria bacterium]
MSDLRPELGDFSSIVCFKAVVTGVEETLGKAAARVALVSAGRKRGVNLVASLGLTGKGNDLDTACGMISSALGADGTRLCNVHSIRQDGDVIKVIVSDTVCMAGEADGTDRICTFTLGAVQGALEALTGRKLKGQHTASRWRGAAEDVFEFQDRA